MELSLLNGALVWTISLEATILTTLLTPTVSVNCRRNLRTLGESGLSTQLYNTSILSGRQQSFVPVVV